MPDELAQALRQEVVARPQAESEAERQRAEEERQRAEAAESQVEQLRAKLREMVVEPE